MEAYPDVLVGGRVAGERLARGGSLVMEGSRCNFRPWRLVPFRAEIAFVACSAVLKVMKANPICLFSLLTAIEVSVSGPILVNSASISFWMRILPGSRAVLVSASMASL